MSNPVIAAISTAQGCGGIGVIRVSGDKAIEICDKIFKSKSDKKLVRMKGYTCAFGSVYCNDEKIDECIATVFLAPHSYTGENVVELSCHGGMIVTRQVLRAVLDSGAAIAQPGEFTKRAFLNGKLDLTQAEAVMDIICAKSKDAAKAALSVKDGTLSQKINAVKDVLINKAAHLSAWADYPEEDISEVTFDELNDALNFAENELEKLLLSYDLGQTLKQGIDTVIIGKPNVGKSTLMNLLSGFEKSIVTDIPGTTRDIVEETVSIGNVVLNLCDTAGIRNSTDIVEKIGVDRAKDKLTKAMLAIAVFDSNRELNDDDLDILKSISNIECIAVINKSDLESKLDISEIEKVTSHVVYMSAKNAGGVEELIKEIENIAGTDKFDPNSAILANERQRTAAQNALAAIIDAKEALTIGMTYDAVTVSIEDAVSNLLQLTGESVTDTVVDSVFHNFCVGK